MLVASGAELDPTLFQKANQPRFAGVLATTVQLLENAGEVIVKHDGFDPVAAGEGIAREIEAEGGEMAEMYGELADSLGAEFMGEIMHSVSGGEAPVSEADYKEAVAQRDEAGTQLTDYVVGYHDFMRTNLVAAYGQVTAEETATMDEQAWTASWRKLKEILGNTEGTLLAEAAIFFDDLVRKKYGKKYKPIEADRGPDVSADVCARTFYVVMQDHLHRAIIGSSRDDWTGQK